jgi:hypothetical protein
MIEWLLSKCFRHEEIDGNGRCPTYLHRWTLWQPRRPAWLWKGFGVYIHKFVGDDWSMDLHDHPKRFVSVGLRGAYLEETPGQQIRVYRAPWVRTFPADHVHRISLPLPSKPCWTLVVVLRHVREWGFWHDGRWWPWRAYVDPANAAADTRRACP